MTPHDHVTDALHRLCDALTALVDHAHHDPEPPNAYQPPECDDPDTCPGCALDTAWTAWADLTLALSRPEPPSPDDHPTPTPPGPTRAAHDATGGNP